MCEATVRVAYTTAQDACIRHRFLHTGLVFGSGCPPMDIHAFMARAGELGVVWALPFH